MTTATTPTADKRFRKFRQVEQEVWGFYGLAPEERLVKVDAGEIIRIHDIGNGDPILFVHGTGGSGVYWAPLIAGLADEFRCILMDRPGWTLSTPIDYSRGDFGKIAANIQLRLLDAIGVDRTHVVGGSIGDLYVLRLALNHPQRVNRIALLGSGPLFDRIEPPTFIRLLRSPLGQIIVRIPQRPGMIRKQMEGLGHKSSLEQEIIPDLLIDLYAATSRYTRAMHNERELVRSTLTPEGFADGFMLTEEEIQAVDSPTLMIYGSNDPIGSTEIWEEFVNLMPDATLEIIDDAGHLNWYDSPAEVSGQLIDHFTRPD